jgi:hypothetical protein
MKAEQYIKEHTRNCSNQIAHWDIGGKNVKPIYSRWLTPDQARKAVEIAREEMIKKVCEYIASNMRCDGYTLQIKSKFIKDLKQVMKDE